MKGSHYLENEPKEAGMSRRSAITGSPIPWLRLIEGAAPSLAQKSPAVAGLFHYPLGWCCACSRFSRSRATWV